MTLKGGEMHDAVSREKGAAGDTPALQTYFVCVRCIGAVRSCVTQLFFRSRYHHLSNEGFCATGAWQAV